MDWRIGPGPVFWYEQMTLARRWQGYALRTMCVGSLLILLALVWRESADAMVRNWVEGRELSLYLSVRAYYFMTITITTLIVIVGPISTAGAICREKVAGGATHLLLTDLSVAEIVLGKYFARLVPVIALPASIYPVLALMTVFGGIEPAAQASIFLVGVGVGVLGCSLALCLSVFASKPQEVLIAIYLIWALWLLPVPLLSYSHNPVPDWMLLIDPYMIQQGMMNATGGVGSIVPALTFFGGCVALSTFLVAVAVAAFRPMCLMQANRPVRIVEESRAARRFYRDVPWWPRPSLDGNPVLWREWQRAIPTRWSRRIWATYSVLATLATIYIIGRIFDTKRILYEMDAESMGTAILVGLGFCMASIQVPTSMAEERARGSLDVLLCTELTSGEILRGKWLGTFRNIPWMMIWPFLIGYAWMLRRWGAPTCLLAYVNLALMLADAALLTSLGLALAMWIRHVDRSMIMCVAIYLFAAVVWPFSCLLFTDDDSYRVAMTFVSPFVSSCLLTYNLRELDFGRGGGQVLALGLVWAAIKLTLALVLFLATLWTFDRCMGRGRLVRKVLPDDPIRPPDLDSRTLSRAGRSA